MSRKFPLMAGLALAAVVVSACTGGGQPAKPAAPAAPAPAPAPAAAPAPAPAQGKSRLDVVKERGKLVCGVNNTLAGFGFMGQDGKYSGFDVDFCKAIAAALFDDPNKVEYRPLNAAQRFTAVQTGEVDVLIRNTTWTVSRDSGALNMEFAPTTFYDGQGMIVRKDSGIKAVKDLNGKSICVQSGTTTELNLADYMRKLGVTYKSVVFADANPAVDAYDKGRCDAYTTDRSGLVSQQQQLSKPDDHVILDEVMSKEPLGPAVLAGDAKWFKAVKWITFAVIEAEDLGISSKNLEEMKKSNDPAVKRFLGLEGKLGEGLGLPNDFPARIVKHVGNYAEIYDRNLGPNTKFKLPRGVNKLWKDGGLLYSPPYR